MIKLESDFRQIGKTYQLIEFARAHGFAVVVPNSVTALQLRKQYDYSEIHSQNDLRGIRSKSVVLDVGVEISNIPNDLDVVTGFTR